MSQGLPVSNVVSVQVSMSQKAVVGRNFGALLILGDSTTIPVSERIREYSSIENVANDFGSDAPEYEAAQLFFEQSPSPTTVYIGRWAKTLASGETGDTEALTDAVTACLDYTDWYGLSIAASSLPENDDIIAVGNLIEAATPSRIFAVNTPDVAVFTATSTEDIAARVKAAALSRTFVQYSSNSAYPAVSAFARAFTVDFSGQNTTITLKFKTEPGVIPEKLTLSQASVAESKNCNLYVTYANGAAILEQGVMGNGDFFDERQNLDWLQDYVQTNLFNLLQGANKVPQTEAGITRLITNVESSMDQAVTNGMVAAGVWTGVPLGQVSTGDTLTKGYYVYALPLSSQAQSDREARKAPLIQVAAKLAGAVHYADVQIDVVR